MPKIETPEEFIENKVIGRTLSESVFAITARDAEIRADERQKAAEEWEKLAEIAGVKLDAILEPIKVWLESLPNGANKDIATNYLHYTQLGFDCWYTAKAQLKAAIMAEPEEARS